MKLVRFQDALGAVHFGRLVSDDQIERLEGSFEQGFHGTGQRVEGVKRLAPLQPVDIICIGLNYRKHAEEGKQAIPEFPVVS